MTTSQSPSPDDGRAQVPGWAAVEGELELEHPDDLEESPEAGAPPPPSSSPSPQRPAEESPDAGQAATSTPGSRPTEDDDDRPPPGAEISSYLDAELEELGASIFDIAGRALNRLYRRRTQTESRLWLATPEESEAFGAAAARIAERHMPEELAEDGDPADAMVMGSVALGYVLRNTAGEEAPISGNETFAEPANRPVSGNVDTSGQAGEQPPAAAPAQVAALPTSTVITPDL